MSRARGVLVVAFLALAGCGSNGGNEDDCNASIRFEGDLYRVHSSLPTEAPLRGVVGRGEIVGCGGMNTDAVGRVEVHRITGVNPRLAVGTRGRWRGLYIREDLAAQPTAWPEPIRP
jgi:hypothetical protein